MIRRRRSGDTTGFGGGFPDDIPWWGYIAAPLAIICFIYLATLTILYIWVPTIVMDFVYMEFVLDTYVTDVLANVGAVLTLLGTLIFLTAFFHLGSSIRLLLPGKEEQTQLMTDGWYAHSRNPLYLGLHIAMIGWILIIPSLLTTLALVIFLINQHFRILTEEVFLENQFGDEYIEYKKQVRRYM